MINSEDTIPLQYLSIPLSLSIPYYPNTPSLHCTVLYLNISLLDLPLLSTLTFFFSIHHSSIQYFNIPTLLRSSKFPPHSISPHYCTSIFLIYFSITSIFLPHSPSLPASAHEETVLIIYPLYISQAIRGFSFVIMYE